MKKLLVIIGCMAFLSLVNCNKPEYTLTMVLNDTSASDGDKAYVELVTEGGDYSADPEYSGSAEFTSSVATVIIDDVEEDTYTGWVYVDANGNSTGFQPENGDDSITGTIDMDDDKTITVSNSEWGTWPI